MKLHRLIHIATEAMYQICIQILRIGLKGRCLFPPQNFNFIKKGRKTNSTEATHPVIMESGVHHLQTIMTESCSGNLENLVCL